MACPVCGGKSTYQVVVGGGSSITIEIKCKSCGNTISSSTINSYETEKKVWTGKRK